MPLPGETVQTKLRVAYAPFDPDFGKQAYHALTVGYIAGELVRRIGKIELRDALREWIAEPLGCQYLTYGMAPELRHRLPQNAITGPRPVWPGACRTSWRCGIAGPPIWTCPAACGSKRCAAVSRSWRGRP